MKAWTKRKRAGRDGEEGEGFEKYLGDGIAWT